MRIDTRFIVDTGLNLLEFVATLALIFSPVIYALAMR